MQPETKPTRKLQVLRHGVAFVGIIALALMIVLYGQRAIDFVQASQYIPSSQLSSITGQIDLSSYGKQLLYASDPMIENQAAFNQDCQSTERAVAILGCYTHRKIYLFDITNSELSGAMEVTAAHEMLHAAYNRLFPWQRQAVDRMIEAEYQKIKDKSDLSVTLAYYAKTEPGQRDNELHSILGTEVANLSPDLESYYSQYFTDRQQVVSLNAKYSSVLASVQSQVKLLSAQINTLGPQLRTDLDTYQIASNILTADMDTYNQKVKDKNFASSPEYTTERNQLLARIAELNAQRISLNERVASYNKIVDKLNSLSTRADQLNSSLNGVTTPAQSL